MRFCLPLVIVLLLVNEIMAQTASPQIEVGKGSRLYSREIAADNFGTFRSASYSTFFRTAPDQPWQRAGFAGKRLRPFLADNEAAMDIFKQYRKTRWAAVGCKTGLLAGEVCTVVSGMFWLLSSLGGDGDDQLGALFFAGLGSSVGFGVGYHLLSRKADRHLQHAVQVYNGKSTSGISDTGQIWQLSLCPSTLHRGWGIGLSFQWY